MPGRSHKIAKIDRWLMCWWAFTGLTHMILEGYFVFSPEFYKEKTPFYLAEVCESPCAFFFCYVKCICYSYLLLTGKEYSKGDSRYAARDAGIVAVEGLTAVLEGPASILAVYDLFSRTILFIFLVLFMK